MLWRAGSATGQLKHAAFTIPSLISAHSLPCSHFFRHLRLLVFSPLARSSFQNILLRTAHCESVLYSALQPVVAPVAQRPVVDKMELINASSLNKRELLSLVQQIFTRTSRERALHKLHHLQKRGMHQLDENTCFQLVLVTIEHYPPYRVKRLLLTLVQLGVQFTLAFYEQVAANLAQRSQWPHVGDIVALAKKQCGVLNGSLLNWKTKAQLERKHFAVLETTLRDFSRENVAPNRQTYHLMLRGHLLNHNLTEARKCLENMVAAGFPIDTTTHRHLISVYHSLGPDVDIETKALQALLGSSQVSDTTLLNTLLRLRVDAGDPYGILHLFKLIDWDLQDRDSTALDGDLKFARQKIPKPGGVIPDKATFAVLIDHFGRLKNIKAVRTMFSLFKQRGLFPDEKLVVALIRAHLAVRAADEALAIVAQVCQHHIPEGVASFRYFGLRNPTIPFGVSGVSPTSGIFNALLPHILSDHGLSGMHHYLKIMRSCHVAPDAKTAHILLMYLNRTQEPDPQELVRVLVTLQRSSILPIRPMIQHVNVILHSVIQRDRNMFTFRGGWKARAAFLSQGRGPVKVLRIHPGQQKPEPHNLLYGIPTFDRYQTRLELRLALQWLRSHHVLGDRATFAMRIRHEAVTRLNLVGAQAIYESMTNHGMIPSAHHVTALMEGYAIQGDAARAKSVMDRAISLGSVQPNLIMYTILIGGYAKQRRPDLAMKAFREMLHIGIKPDIASIDAIVGAYFTVKSYGSARRALLELWPLVAPLDESLLQMDLKALIQKLRSFEEPDLRKFEASTRCRVPETRKSRWRQSRYHLKLILHGWAIGKGISGSGKPRPQTIRSLKSEKCGAGGKHGRLATVSKFSRLTNDEG